MLKLSCMCISITSNSLNLTWSISVLEVNDQFVHLNTHGSNIFIKVSEVVLTC